MDRIVLWPGTAWPPSVNYASRRSWELPPGFYGDSSVAGLRKHPPVSQRPRGLVSLASLWLSEGLRFFFVFTVVSPVIHRVQHSRLPNPVFFHLEADGGKAREITSGFSLLSSSSRAPPGGGLGTTAFLSRQSIKSFQGSEAWRKSERRWMIFPEMPGELLVRPSGGSESVR